MGVGVKGVQECGGQRRRTSGCQVLGTSSCCQSRNGHGPWKPSGLGVAAVEVGAPCIENRCGLASMKGRAMSSERGDMPQRRHRQGLLSQF